MHEFRAKMAENGRIVIPASCRQLLDIEPGEDLILIVEDHELRLFSLKHSLQKAKSLVRLRAKNKSLVKELKRQRQLEKDND